MTFVLAMVTMVSPAGRIALPAVALDWVEVSILSVSPDSPEAMTILFSVALPLVSRESVEAFWASILPET